LVKAIDQNLHLLKRPLPYHESDHLLNLANNILVGGTRLEDIEFRRRDEAWIDALVAKIIPDETFAQLWDKNVSDGAVKIETSNYNNLIKNPNGGIISFKINPFGRRNGLQGFQQEFELWFHPPSSP